MMARWVIITTIIITIIINHCPNNDGEVGQITFAQTLGAGSVEEQLAFEARYEFVTITKVIMMMMLVMMMITKIKISNKV